MGLWYCVCMGTQLELSFDSKVTLQADGSYRVEPGRLRARQVEEWRRMSEVMRDSPGELPYRDRQMNVALIECGEIRGRRRGAKGWWEVEMNSVRDYFRRSECNK